MVDYTIFRSIFVPYSSILDPKEEIKTFSCKDCGGDLQFNPGTDVIECPYCGVENKITIEKKEIEELDFASFLEKAEQEEQKEEIIVVRCNSCGAQITLEKNITASECPFCASKIVAQGKSIKKIKPKSLLPFKIGKKQAAESFKIWLKKYGLLPTRLKILPGYRDLMEFIPPIGHTTSILQPVILDREANIIMLMYNIQPQKMEKL